MKNNLVYHQDWIVLNNSMNTLWEVGQKDEDLKAWLLLQMERLASDGRKSVSKRADKILKSIS